MLINNQLFANQHPTIVNQHPTIVNQQLTIVNQQLTIINQQPTIINQQLTIVRINSLSPKLNTFIKRRIGKLEIHKLAILQRSLSEENLKIFLQIILNLIFQILKI